MKANPFQSHLLSNMKYMWLFIVSFTMIIIIILNSQVFIFKLWTKDVYSDQIKQRIDLTYWRFNYTDPDDLDDILSLKKPNYLKTYKNPCWHEALYGSHSSNIKFVLRCLPYFYLIGADKCGTTDLFLRLLKHPEIIKTKAYFSKETMWWAWTRFGYSVFTRGLSPTHFLGYLKIFNSAITQIQARNDPEDYHQCIIGDGSPNALWDFTGWNKIPQNHGLTLPKYLTPHCIHHLTPNVKLIVILRNPIDRLFSDFLFVREKHKAFKPSQRVRSRENFHVQVVNATNNLKKCIHKNSLKYCLFNKIFHLDSFLRFEVGFYSVYLKEWFKVFPRNQFYILRSEDYRENMKKHIKNIFKFLNLTKLPESDLNKIKVGKLINTRRKDVKHVKPMFNKTRKLLKDLYQPFNNELAVLLKNDKYRWET